MDTSSLLIAFGPLLTFKASTPTLIISDEFNYYYHYHKQWGACVSTGLLCIACKTNNIFCILNLQFFPRWLAPNVLTFSGWCLLFMIFAVTSYYDPHFTASSQSDPEKHLPSVWWLIFAVAQFIAHTLDGCDGKQARRTNSRYWIYIIIYTEKFVPVPTNSANTVSDLTRLFIFRSPSRGF